MRYDFTCDNCNSQSELTMSMREAPGIGERHSEPCPVCKASSLRRVLSTTVGINAEYQRARNQYPYVSRQFGPLKGINRKEGTGQVIESVAHEREVMAMNGLRRD